MFYVVNQNQLQLHPWAGYEYTETLSKAAPAMVRLASGEMVPSGAPPGGHTVQLKGHGVDSFLLPPHYYDTPFFWQSSHGVTQQLKATAGQPLPLLYPPGPGTLHLTTATGEPTNAFRHTPEGVFCTAEVAADEPLTICYHPLLRVVVQSYKVQAMNNGPKKTWELVLQEVSL